MLKTVCTLVEVHVWACNESTRHVHINAECYLDKGLDTIVLVSFAVNSDMHMYHSQGHDTDVT